MNAETTTQTRSNKYPVEPRKFGSICKTNCSSVPTDVHAYLLDEDGAETQYIGRVRGRPVSEVADNLREFVEDSGLCYEWATLGQAYKYGPNSKDDECPEHSQLAVYVTSGGSEGHLVHVDMLVTPKQDAGNAVGYQIANKLLMVKVLSGSDEAQKIARLLEAVLGVL